MTRARSTLLDFLTAAGTSPPLALIGTVTAVDVGGAVDGNALVTVDWMGTEVHASYGATYTPVVGHVVLMLRTQPLFIVDRVIGTPPT